MGDSLLYWYRDHMDDEFPFKLEIRDNSKLNQRVHAHEHLQICYLRRGTCSHSIGGKEAELRTGDIFSIPPFLEHSIKEVENHEVEIVQIDFMPFLINENMKDLSCMESFVDFAYIQPFVSTGEGLLPKLNISSESQILVTQLINDMEKEFLLKEEGYRISIKADLLKFLVTIGRDYKNFIHDKKDKQIISDHRRGLYKTIDYMNHNFSASITLDQMADMAMMSSTYYSHMFRLLIGKTYVEFLNGIRIQAAMKMLKETDYPVMGICLNVGFNHIGHFNKTFKKIVGITPTHYRRK